MKIVVDLTQLSDNLSGLERYGMCITREMILSDKKNEYVLLYKNHACKLLTDIHARENVTYRVYQGKRKLVFNQLKLPFYLYREKGADKYLFFAFPCPLLFKKKGIYTLVADLTCWDMPKTMKKKAEIYFKATISHSIRVSEKIVTISEFSRQRILQHFGQGNQDGKKKKSVKAYKRLEDKIILAYCGVSDDFVKAEPCDADTEHAIREKYHLPDNYFLCLSTLEPRKNLTLLLAAYSRMLSRCADGAGDGNAEQRGKQGKNCNPTCEKGLQIADIPKLVLAGRKGWLTDEMLADIHEKFPDQVVVTGFIEEQDLPQIYRMAKCFVFPSMYEGFGMPPLEALAVGTPVISSDAASMPEVLGEHATYFESGNEEALEDVMLASLPGEGDRDEDRDTKKETNRFVDPRFDWRKSAQRILEEITG